VEQTLIDEMKGGIPALVALVPAIAVIRFVCGRLRLRRLRVALSLVALTVSLAVFRRMAPTIAQPFTPYIWVITTFAGIYFLFKLGEVLLLDVFWHRAGHPQPPGIFRDVLSAVFASVLFVLLLQVGLDVHVTAVIITSAALSIFLGLALQQTVSDVFAGVALVMERPFEPGHWVKVGERVGQVEEITWRAVRIRLQRVDDYLIVPNSVIAKADIVNMSSPTCVHGATVEVGAAYGHAPNRVREVMVATAEEVEGVLARPAPVADLLRFDASSIAYRLTYWIEDFPRSLEIESAVRAHLWYAFQRAGIEIPFPTVNYYSRPLSEARAVDEAARQARVTGLFRRMDFLSALKPEQLEALATTAPLVRYPSGAFIVRKGEAGDSLFIIASGRVSVIYTGAGAPPDAVTARDVGEYFGELSLLTDAPRPVDVRADGDVELIVLTRDVMRPLLVADPGVAERLSQTLSRHRAGDQEVLTRLAGAGAHPIPVAYPASTILSNIRRVFGLVDLPGPSA